MSLWQKPDQEPRTNPAPRQDAPARAFSEPTPAASPNRGNAHVGQSIEIRGELTGNEDLTIDGKIEGKVNLKGHNLTIGEHGQVQAELRAKNVSVIGKVVGNITAEDRIEIGASGSVEGDLTAPRVALADGSSFKGSIDMSGKPGASSSTTHSAASGSTSGSSGSREVAMAARSAKS